MSWSKNSITASPHFASEESYNPMIGPEHAQTIPPTCVCVCVWVCVRVCSVCVCVCGIMLSAWGFARPARPMIVVIVLPHFVVSHTRSMSNRLAIIVN